MKKTDDLGNLSVEELIEKKKKLKSIYTGLAIPMVIACLALLYLSIKNKNYALIGVAMGCCITLLPGFTVINGINNEIKKRDQKNLLN